MAKELFTFRIDPVLSHELDFFMEHHKITNESFAARKALKLGFQANRLIIGRDTKIDSNLEMETMIDLMSTEQKEKLLELLVQKLGAKTIADYRMLTEMK